MAGCAGLERLGILSLFLFFFFVTSIVAVSQVPRDPLPHPLLLLRHLQSRSLPGTKGSSPSSSSSSSSEIILQHNIMYTTIDSCAHRRFNNLSLTVRGLLLRIFYRRPLIKLTTRTFWEVQTPPPQYIFCVPIWGWKCYIDNRPPAVFIWTESPVDKVYIHRCGKCCRSLHLSAPLKKSNMAEFGRIWVGKKLCPSSKVCPIWLL